MDHWAAMWLSIDTSPRIELDTVRTFLGLASELTYNNNGCYIIADWPSVLVSCLQHKTSSLSISHQRKMKPLDRGNEC